jgi:FtsH-binding integral membrane protein
LGLLYLGKAINERNLTNGYIAAISLLISWYIQVLGRDLSGIQYYTIPAGLYLLTLAFFEVRRSNAKPNLSTTANILGVLILGCSSFLQSSLYSQENVLFFVLLTGIEGVLLTLWGLFAKFKTVFIGGILTFILNILYQVAFLLSGLNGALVALGVGVLIILTVVIIERTKTRLISKSNEWTNALESWHW